MTYEEILQRVLSRVSDNFDKREGSIIYDAIAPACAELAQLYIMLDYSVNSTFADTAQREYLVRRANERGVFVKPATFATAIAVFNIDVPIGTRFSSTNFNWVVTEKIASMRFSLQCETAGSAANAEFGSLIPIEYISGLGSAEIEKIEAYGEDEEDTEVLRKRYFESFENQAFGGNKQDYYNKITAIQGVGGCKVFRGTNKQGQIKGAYVLAMITNSNYAAPDSTLVSKIQQIIDPRQDQNGDGLAPIGHICNIEAVRDKVIDIEANITYDTGFSFEALKSKIEKTIDEYFLELNKMWDKETSLTVRISAVESRILAVEGIKDIADTTLNTQDSNITLEYYEIALRGVVNG